MKFTKHMIPKSMPKKFSLHGVFLSSNLCIFLSFGMLAIFILVIAIEINLFDTIVVFKQ